MFRLIVQGVPGEAPIQHFATPIEVEAAYLRICSRVRTDGPGAVKIPADRAVGIPPAYFRLDRNWEGQREQEVDRMGLWTATAEGYVVPLAFQLRGSAQVLGMSGEAIGRALGITGRVWRYYLSEEGERREMPWTTWRVIRLWLESLEP